MRLTRIETIHLAEHATLLFVRLHTDEGLVGTGDTFMMAEALEGYIHGRAAPKILGRDPADIGRIWASLYDWDAARFGGQGIEVRAISAIDVALWDLLGKSLNAPVYRLLGGRANPRVRLYNTCFPLRYDSPVGLLRVDLALPLAKRDDDRGYQIYFGIGHSY